MSCRRQAADNNERVATRVSVGGERTSGCDISFRYREITIPNAHQTRHTVLRVAEGHPGPSVFGPVPVLFRRVLHHLLDIIHHRVAGPVRIQQTLMNHNVRNNNVRGRKFR